MLLTISSSSYAGVINEDRIWHYWIEGPDIDRNCVANISFQMKFDGTEDIDGKTYSVLKTINSQKYIFNNTTRKWEYVCDLKNSSRFYLREEGTKTYIYNRGYGNLYFREFNYDGENLNEFLLYDFGLEIGEGYVTEDLLSKLQLTLKDKIYYPDHQFTLNLYSGDSELYPRESTYLAIDGIGTCGELRNSSVYNNGYSLVFFRNILIAGFYYISDYDDWLPAPGYTDLYMDKVTDLEGNIIFKPDMLKVSGINVIEMPTINNNNHIFDIYGRQVNCTTSGSIYIKKGKKFIAK